MRGWKPNCKVVETDLKTVALRTSPEFHFVNPNNVCLQGILIRTLISLTHWIAHSVLTICCILSSLNYLHQKVDFVFEILTRKKRRGGGEGKRKVASCKYWQDRMRSSKVLGMESWAEVATHSRSGLGA